MLSCSLEKPWFTVTPCWPLRPGQPEVGPYLKKYITDFQRFYTDRLLEHWKLNLGYRDPVLTFTSGSTGSGTISQEVHSRFSIFFSVIGSLGTGKKPWFTLTPYWPLLPGQPEVGPYLKKYTADFQTFYTYRLLGHWILALVYRDPMLTLTSGSTGSGTISQELNTRFSNFFTNRPIEHSRLN